MDRQHRNRHRHEDLTGGRAGVRVRRGGGDGDGGAAMEGSRRGRFYHHDGPGPGAAAAVPVVDQAECTAQTCRSCVAVTLADAIALGCCPCAVVSLLGLAFVKAPLALARRCLRRLRRRRGELRHKKRVRDLDGGPAAAKVKCRRSTDAPAAGGRGHGYGAMEALHADDAAWLGGLEVDGRGAADTRARASNSSSSAAASGRLDAEKVWMEMYRVGHWGFGRLSISVSPPPAPPLRPCRIPDNDGDGGRKDVNLRCES